MADEQQKATRIGFHGGTSLLAAPRGKRNPRTLNIHRKVYDKICYMRDHIETEVGFFGVSHPDDPFSVVDLIMPKQQCTGATVAFDPDDVADIAARLAGDKIFPDRWQRIWIHTHPGGSAHPSATDEDTLSDSFANAEWAIMLIFGKGEHAGTTCRFRLHTPSFYLDRELNVAIYDNDGKPEWDTELKEKVSRPFVQGAMLLPPNPTEHQALLHGTSRSGSASSSGESSVGPSAKHSSSSRSRGGNRVGVSDIDDSTIHPGHQDFLRGFAEELAEAGYMLSPNYNGLFEKYNRLPFGDQYFIDEYLRDEHHVRLTSAGLL